MTRVLPNDLFNPKYKFVFNGRNFYPRRTFKYGVLKYSTVAFILGGFIFTDSDFLSDSYNSRPDYNSMRIMTGPIPDVERKVFEMYEGNYFGKEFDD